MAQVDDLKVGDFIAVTACRERVSRPRPFGEGADEELVWNELHLSGEPLEILAIALPWLVCADRHGGRYTLDVRHQKVAASSRAMVRALDGKLKPRRSRQQVREAKQEAALARRCGRCGEAMHERLINAVRGEWGLVCPACDAQGQTARSR